MGFKYYEQNQLMIPMEWKTLIDKNDVVFVLNDLIENMNIDKLLETYSPLGNSSYSPKMMLKNINVWIYKKKIFLKTNSRSSTMRYKIHMVSRRKQTNKKCNKFI